MLQDQKNMSKFYLGVGVASGGDIPEYRTRSLTQLLSTSTRNDVFAATPPLEALRWILSEAATLEGTGDDKVVMLSDVARAFFEADATRLVCVELPPELRALPGNQDKVALLNKSLYGTRGAAMNWQNAWTRL